MYSFGRIFKINIFGESHGYTIGVTIDGCPPGISINIDNFKDDLLKRRGSNIKGTTSRKEKDLLFIASGVFKNKTTGAPITILFKNQDLKSSDYNDFLETPRPGHADFVANKKYKGFNDYRGGGQFSGRMTVALVAAGVIAKKILNKSLNLEFDTNIIEIGGSKRNIERRIQTAIELGDSLGGIIECKVKNIPIGLGEPFFDSVESLISHLAFSIPGIKGIEFGNGFNCAKIPGSKNNDLIISVDGTTSTNNCGGINGGITNGNPLIFRVAIKPTSSISQQQLTLNIKTKKMDKLKVKGRHDACFALRVPIIVEAMTAIALTDLLLLKKLYKI